MSCPPGFQTVRIAKAKNKPGSCCDKYECVPLEYDCSHVKCTKPSVEKCPSDSYRPPEVLPEHGCCPIIEPCRCAAGKCPPVSCLPNHRLNITRKGNGTPGSCCDLFDYTVLISLNYHLNHKNQNLIGYALLLCTSLQCLSGLFKSCVKMVPYQKFCHKGICM
ncbi:unnamed protein product [Soboliphyme baturini]|uniref:GRANULINS domain-containing protein n=1 Tax=Soboliphyme baturini TaxID=241478 RepID=A0A183IEY3_9BILA|nr:unnamed protein product [Soboliphyme baturini]